MKSRVRKLLTFFFVVLIVILTACGSADGLADSISEVGMGNASSGISSESAPPEEHRDAYARTVEDCVDGSFSDVEVCSELMHDRASEVAASRADTEINNHLIFVDEEAATGSAIAPPSTHSIETERVLSTLTEGETLRFKRVMRVIDSVDDIEETPYSPVEGDVAGGIFATHTTPDEDAIRAEAIDAQEYIQDCQHYAYWRFYDYFQFVIAKNQVNSDPTAIAELAFGEGDAAIGETLASEDKLQAFGGDVFSVDHSRKAFLSRKKAATTDLEFSDYANKRVVRNEFYLLNNRELAMLETTDRSLWRAVRINTATRRANRSFVNINNRGWQKHRRFYRALRDEPVEVLIQFYNQRKAFVELLEQRREVWKLLKPLLDGREFAEGCAEERASLPDSSWGPIPISVGYCDSIDNLDHEIIVALKAAKENGCIGHTSKTPNACDWAPQDFVDDVTSTWGPKVDDEESRCNNMDYDVSHLAYHAYNATITAPAVYTGVLSPVKVCRAGNVILDDPMPGADSIDIVSSVRELKRFIQNDEARRETVIACLADSPNPPRAEYQSASDKAWGSREKFRVCLDKDFQTKLTDTTEFSEMDSWDDFMPTLSAEFNLYATWGRSSCAASEDAPEEDEGRRWPILSISKTIKVESGSEDEGSTVFRVLGRSIEPSKIPTNIAPRAVHLEFLIMGIPLHVQTGIAGKAGVTSTLVGKATDFEKSVSGKITPFASVDGFASLGAGIPGLLDAGVRGDLNLIKASVPTTAKLKVGRSNKGTPASQFTVGTRIGQDFVISSLSGKISAYLETFWNRYSAVLFGWSGATKKTTLWSKDWEYSLEQLQAAGL